MWTHGEPKTVRQPRGHAAADARGRGIGHQLYDELSAMALADGCEVMTAEMDIEPPNTHSLHFHRNRGFVEHGQRELDGGKRVSMQCRDLSPMTHS